jgi:hypothetical protein
MTFMRPPVQWMPLHGTLPQSPIEGLTPEDWYFTK